LRSSIDAAILGVSGFSRSRTVRRALLAGVILLTSGAPPGCGYTILGDKNERAGNTDPRTQRRLNEDKLDIDLQHILRLAERAESSSADGAALQDTLTVDGDGNGLLPVVVEVWSMSRMEMVTSQLDSLGVIVESGNSTRPFIECRVHPLDLRGMAALEGVMRVDLKPRGHGQLHAR